MEKITFYMIMSNTFAVGPYETNISFTNEESAKEYCDKMNKKAKCCFYKKVEKKCYSSLEEYEKLQDERTM